MITVSVCMATYNGEKNIREQIDSILSQLSDKDELVISDDGSQDDTIKIIQNEYLSDKRVHLVKGPHTGFSNNFENAVKHATGDIIAFSDQDDIWFPEKAKTIKEIFDSNHEVTTVLHKMMTFRGDLNDLGEEITVGYHQGVISNWYKSSYWGCCMAVRRNFVMRFIPFRKYCVGHDQLTGLMTEKYGKALFYNKPLIYHRIHSSNTSGTMPFKKKIDFRVNLLKDFIFASKIYHNKQK